MHKLRELRVGKDLTQSALSRLSGVSQVTISFTENGRSYPGDLTKARLAKALGVKVPDIWPEKDD